MLGSGESLFRDTVALDYDYLPKILPFREKEQRRYAQAIQPLFMDRDGRNLFVYGAPGIGKTAACKHVLRELEEETDDIVPLYINCWKHNTTYKILLEICNLLGMKFVVNKKTPELFALAKKTLNKTRSVMIFDEVDKAEETDFLYMLLEEVYKKTIILITNYKHAIKGLNERITSRLNAEMLEFFAYNEKETAGILTNRMKYAFVPGVWEDDAVALVAKRASEEEDIRRGLYLMKEAGNIAEEHASKKIMKAHVEKAIAKTDEFVDKAIEMLDGDTQTIMKVVAENSGAKIGDLYKDYLEKGGSSSYKTFARKIEKLRQRSYVKTEKRTDSSGNTTLVSANRKLTEF